MLSINNLYKELEQKKDFDNLDFALLSDNYSDLDKSFIDKEFMAFFPLSIFKEKKQIKDNKEEFVDYYLKRLQKTKNKYLSARYSHILYLLEHQSNWCNNAIENYKAIIDELFEKEENAYNIVEIIEYLILFSLEQKNLRSSIKNEINNYIRNGNRLLLFYIKRIIIKYNYFKISEVSFLPNRCIEYATNENDYSICKGLLELGLYFAKKDTKQYKNLIPKFYELLGDNERQEIKEYDGKPENLMIPHMNQAIYKQMMDYYKKSGHKEKYELSSKLYCNNKNNLKYLKFTHQIKQDPKITEFLHYHFDNIKNMSPKMICLYLCIGDPFVFMSNDRLEKFAEKMKVQTDFYQVVCDINQNERIIDEKERYKTKVYEIALNNHLKYVVDVIFSSVQTKRLSYSILKNFLLKFTYYGEEFKVQRGDSFISYKWFDFIDIAIKDFFEQISNCINEKKPDYRIPIDILSIKFEGIIRDIIALKDGVVSKIGKNGETSNMLLEELLRQEDVLFRAGFDIDDITLFRFVLTEKGLNIRNNVAHSFYKPQDYTLGNAILIFLCVLRLAKFEKMLDISEKTN